MSDHKKPQPPELIQALKEHRLPHDKPSQLADSFRHGWQAARRALLAAVPAHPAEGVPAQAVQPSDALIEVVDAWFADNTGLGGCSDKDVAELAAIFATQPAAQGLVARDAAFEAVRKAFCNLQRYSFWLDSRGNVRRCADRSGNWVEFEAAHTLFDPQSVDAAIAAQAKQGGV